MIERIAISDLGVIERAEVELHPGFNVVTGETGAGKTMVVTAFGLLLGARAEATTVRAGADKAAVDAEVTLSAGHSALTLAEGAGALLEEDEADAEQSLLLGRALSSKGRSRAAVSGRAVPVSVLGQIGAELVTVHGQSDQLRLKSASAQRQALEVYAGEDFRQALERYRQQFGTYQRISAELDEITGSERERRREAEQLQQALEQIDAISPEPGEDERLKAESLRLENVESLREAARTAQTALAGGDVADAMETGTHAVELVESAATALSAVTDEDDQLNQIASQVSEISTLLTDAAGQLGLYAASLDESGPERLTEVHTRRAEIDRLLRLYGPDIDTVLAWAEDSRQRLMTLQGDDDRIAELTEEVQRSEAQLWEQATELRRRRAEAGTRLEEAVSEELTALAMPHARLVAQVKEVPELDHHGADTVALLLAPDAGANPLPLGKGASGGELSRVMLALEVVLAEQAPAATFIFDEVDAGVGGKAAVQIGQRLGMLARHAQVIVVTHLPQVAAYADRHIRVYKDSDEAAGFTASDVHELSAAERIGELARMLAGREDSESARAHAAELLDAAAQELKSAS